MSKEQSTPKCCELLRGKGTYGAFHMHMCGKKAKAQDDNGNWFCGIHSPEAKEKRKNKSGLHWAEKRDKWRAEAEHVNRKIICYEACEGISNEALESGVIKELLEALEQMEGEFKWTEASPDSQSVINKARATIAKAKGE